MRTIHSALLSAALLAGAAPPALAQPAPPPGALPPGSGPRGPAALFALVDADGDGRVTLEELWGYVQARFAAADRNRDGALVLEEAQAMRLTPAPDGAPRPGFGPMRARVVAAVFRAVDADRDGRVTPEEVRPAVTAQFRALDANGDDGVTLDELPVPRWGRHHGHPRFDRPDAPPPSPPR